MNTARWLKIKDATQYCPYGKKKLIALIQNRDIKGGQLHDNKNAWFLDRLSLDEYLENQCFDIEIEHKCIDYLRSVK